MKYYLRRSALGLVSVSIALTLTLSTTSDVNAWLWTPENYPNHAFTGNLDGDRDYQDGLDDGYRAGYFGDLYPDTLGWPEKYKEGYIDGYLKGEFDRNKLEITEEEVDRKEKEEDQLYQDGFDKGFDHGRLGYYYEDTFDWPESYREGYIDGYGSGINEVLSWSDNSGSSSDELEEKGESTLESEVQNVEKLINPGDYSQGRRDGEEAGYKDGYNGVQYKGEYPRVRDNTEYTTGYNDAYSSGYREGLKAKNKEDYQNGFNLGVQHAQNGEDATVSSSWAKSYYDGYLDGYTKYKEEGMFRNGQKSLPTVDGGFYFGERILPGGGYIVVGAD